MGRYSEAERAALAREVRDDGFCVLRQHYPREVLAAWATAFTPLLERHIEAEGHLQNRGSGRYYVTLPFVAPWAEPRLYEDEDLLAIVDELVGPGTVMCQLATDTPVAGSQYQDIHRDAPPLFAELPDETPVFQLAVNFPLCDVTLENGPFEVARGTHRRSKAEGLAMLERGEAKLESVMLALGDVMVRDVRGLHRGTPNRIGTPRPMVVIGYSRRWLRRPEVSIHVPRAMYSTLSPRARELLRFEPTVDAVEPVETEVYQAYAY